MVPDALPPFITTHAEGVTLAIKVQPRASSTGLAGVHGGELKVKVTAPPVDSAANEAVIRLFAELLGCPRANISVLRGETSRHKVLLVRGVSLERVTAEIRV